MIGRKEKGETIFDRLGGSRNKKNNWDMKWADAELASSNALSLIVLDLDIWVRFGFNGFKRYFRSEERRVGKECW